MQANYQCFAYVMFLMIKVSIFEYLNFVGVEFWGGEKLINEIVSRFLSLRSSTVEHTVVEVRFDMVLFCT